MDKIKNIKQKPISKHFNSIVLSTLCTEHNNNYVNTFRFGYIF